MKVKIGPYINIYTTESLDDLWYKFRYNKSNFLIDKRDKYDDYFDWCSDIIQTCLNSTINKIQNTRKRHVYVDIDYSDIISADETLAHIILPVLKMLKTKKKGSPCVDLDDRPAHLIPVLPPNPYTGDEYIHDAWDWVIDEMIWAFEQKNKDWEDIHATTAYQNRLSNGFALFGKYYEGLWV